MPAPEGSGPPPEEMHIKLALQGDEPKMLRLLVERTAVKKGLITRELGQIAEGCQLEIGLPEGEVLVGIVGRIHPVKRQLVFLRAAEQVLRESRKSVRFFMIGEPNCLKYRRELDEYVAQKELGGSVVFTGRRHDMPEVLRSLDILVSLSGGSVMFEAMGCGKAVVSAGFSSKADSVHLQDGRTGVLVGSSEPSELAAALRRLVEDAGLRERIGAEARKWAEQRFCHIEMATRLERLYEQLESSLVDIGG